MYVNPFWFGVASTIGIEVVLVMALAIYLASKK